MSRHQIRKDCIPGFRKSRRPENRRAMQALFKVWTPVIARMTKVFEKMNRDLEKVQ